MSIPHTRNFSISQIIFFPLESRLPATSVEPFLELTDDISSFVEEMLLRDFRAIEQLNHTIQDNNGHIRSMYNSGNLATNNDAHIAFLNNLIEQDINERHRYQESAELLGAIYIGEEPPIHNMDAWLNLRIDLDNNEDPNLHNLREYVQEVINTHINNQFLEIAMDAITTGRENLSETESRDNSQYSDELDESDLSSESASDVYHSANTHQDESSYNDSDSDDNSFVTDQDLNSNDSLPDVNNEFNSDINLHQDNHESNTNIDQSFDENKSNSGSDEKYITDDFLDISDTLHMFYDESPQSTVDFVLQRQQEEMPDIMDSDGGE